MPFSLTSYLLGVATVVGALPFGFGSGLFMTKTVMKETAAEPNRLEQVSHLKRGPAAELQAANSQGANPAGNPAPPVEPAPAVHSDPVPPAQAVPPVQAELLKPDSRKEKASARDSESSQQPEPANQREQRTANPAEPNQTEHREGEPGKTAERKIERKNRYAERKTRAIAATRTKPPRWEVQGESESPEVVFGREEPHFDLFRMPALLPFGHSEDRND